ncbi:MAG: 50S ribosomal protein L11 methyltransferase [Planctomycetes bacterium]|nr:50S ribosomal protein L11 methyltransferase [Planctomycetota bacterium]
MHVFRLGGLTEGEAEARRRELLALATGGAVIEEKVPARDAAERDARPSDPRRFDLLLYALDDDEARALGRSLAARDIRHAQLDLGEVDWEEAWKERHPALDLGRALHVVPPWNEDETPTGRLRVVIEPGMAFGLGDADSTRFSYELLEAALTRGDRVADVGCGSGLLAIAARRLGAGRVEACDVEAAAAEATCANALRNAIALGEAEPAFLVHQGSVETLDGPFDLIVANIVWEIIEPMLPALILRLAPAGRLVIGGIRPAHVPALLARAGALGLAEVERRVGQDIAAFLLS